MSSSAVIKDQDLVRGRAAQQSPRPKGPRSAAAREERRLPWYHALVTAGIALALSVVILAGVQALVGLLPEDQQVNLVGRDFSPFSLASVLVFGYVLHLAVAYVYSRLREGRRWAMDRVVTLVVTGAFVIAMIPLVSLLAEVVARGLPRLLTPGFLTGTMQGFTGGADGGGILHAIVGTVLITLGASIISIPIGLFTAVFLVEYSKTGVKRMLGRGVTFLVDVMTGIPSIVAGLFALALFITITNDPGIRSGLMGSVALSLLMIPTVVRSSEEMIRLVPHDLREAALALGVPRWIVTVRVVLRTAIAGLTTSVTLAVARVIGETAPLMFTIGGLTLLNANLFEGRMAALPLVINGQYAAGAAPCSGDTVINYFTRAEYACNTGINLERAWATALTLIILVMVLNVVARLVSYYFAPKTGR
ncbi:phosphate ABC transporter permease PstA [Helcobacillus massiliensis]|uniref:Phosphate transport system permease protein PstA n=1 Tax=Helcobacillus massiliensis TaxID=521392 RepID=A0A839QT52_9MICO|nr:phosphate ABC transporter permease PstA [Helcobacillus massiliensis]MBB3023242.1 phosphate transport system permease protein [Helcobacillus massiliensis]MCT1556583.1 phosphate ABC transporter permease PstA [Helcobacillus massiliensis]MCT2035777.1 phosphate ABC transporter permease PstA [Helcobacillus massiliensis]MCT2331141.1 phosphate ABC transporter permease PstA [Helcobacillus massiliensis]